MFVVKVVERLRELERVFCHEGGFLRGNGCVTGVIEHPGFVVIVPLLSDGRVVMERIYRYPWQRVNLECPSGGLDGEDPEIAARRELEEETGYRVDRLIWLGKYSASSGISNEEFSIFLAADVRAEGVLQREITEDIEIELIPLADLRAGRLHHEYFAVVMLRPRRLQRGRLFA